MGQSSSSLHLAAADKALVMLAELCQVAKRIEVKIESSAGESYAKLADHTPLRGRATLAHFIVRAASAPHKSGFIPALPAKLGHLASLWERHTAAGKPGAAAWSPFAPERVLELVGTDDGSQAAIDAALELDASTVGPGLASEDAAERSAALEKLERVLMGATFAVGHRLSLADVMLYSSLYGCVATMSSAQRIAHADVVRYFDLVQHIVGQEYERLGRDRPYAAVELDLDAVPFVPHVPPVKAKAKPQSADPAAKKATGAADKAVSGKAAPGKKADPTAAKAPKKAPAAAPAAVNMDPSCLLMIVARVEKVDRHPDADTLYVEDMDLGPDGHRTVISGLVKHVTEDELRGRLVVLLANLKPAKMRGIESQAMVFCATDKESGRLEFVDPPAGAKPGDRIRIEGYDGVEPDALLNPKKKQFDGIQPHFTTTSELVAGYLVPAGSEGAGSFRRFVGPDGSPCRVKSIVGASIR